MRLQPSPSRPSGCGTRCSQCLHGICAVGGTKPPCGACCPKPMCRLALRAPWCRALQSCLPPLPLAGAPGSGGPVALLHEQPARRRTRTRPQAGRVRGKTPARWIAAPKAARSAARMRSHCTRDDTATDSSTTCSMARRDARQRAASRRPSWARLQPDRMRNADHGRCTDRPEVAAVERRRIGDTEQKQLAGPKAAALLPGWQRPAPAVGR